MKILHIVENYSLKSGGVRTVVKNLTEELNTYNYHSLILSSQKEFKDKNVVVVDCVKRPWLYSHKWRLEIEKIHNLKKIDLIHIHGVWMYPQIVGAKFAIKNNIPFVLSPHGMYEPRLWEKGTFKKKKYFNLLAKKLFYKAKTIHAITGKEKENLRILFNNVEIFEIPNLVKNSFSEDKPYIENEKYILFLGRLDPIKGIELLIEAFIRMKFINVKLKIAGEKNNYSKELEKNYKLKDIDSIEFLGFVNGKTKEQLLKNAFVLVTPSYSEVIGMVNLEAAIAKTPVITTYQTGLSKSWISNGGFLINPNIDELSKALKEVLNWSNEKRLEKGNELFHFVQKEYSWKYRIKDWNRLYKSSL